MCTPLLTKNLLAITSVAPRPIITWDRAERIRRNKEIFDNKSSIVHRLPEHYKKRYWENFPIIGYSTPETDQGLWGGETVIKGYIESKPYTKKKILPRHWVPHFFFPELKRTVLYSEVLDKHLTVIVTERACRKIDDCGGLDSYLLETPEIDLASKLANKLKREILLTLAKSCYYPNNQERRDFIRRKYEKHISPVEEAEWVGLDLNEACRKLQDIEDSVKPEPIKFQYERELVERLASGEEDPDDLQMLKDLETETIIAEKAKNVMQTATARVKKVFKIAKSKLG